MKYAMFAMGSMGLLMLVVPASAASIAPEDVAGCVDGYLAVQRALAADDLRGAKAGANGLHRTVSMTGVPPEDAATVVRLGRPALAVASAKDLEGARKAFRALTEATLNLVSATGDTGGRTLYLAHCPMAFDGEGGDWIQDDDEPIENPYFGSAMLRCGTIEGRLDPEGVSEP